jgi:hypothetical protein
MLWRWLKSNFFTLFIWITALNTLRNISLLVRILVKHVLTLSNIVLWFWYVILTIQFAFTVIILNVMWNRLFHSESRSTVMSLWSLWWSLLMLWTLSSKSLFRNFWIWFIIIIRLNFWFRFRISLLLVLCKLRILFNWFLVIVLFHNNVLFNLWIIAITFMAWLFLLSFLSWSCLHLLLTCFVL